MEKENGYEPLDPELSGGVFPIPVSVLRSVDSTNTEARRRLLAGESAPFAIFAEEQTAGRGRMGRSFYSPKGTGIYLTLCFSAREGDPLFLTTAAAVAVHRAIESVTGLVVSIKWVNDLYYGGRKVSGILAESLTLGDERYVILGVGVNLYTDEFPDELREIAGGLSEAGAGLRNRLASALLSELGSLMGEIDRSAYIKTYRTHSMILGQSVVYCENGRSREGVAASIDEMGRLTVRHSDGSEKILASGEISLRLNKQESER